MVWMVAGGRRQRRRGVDRSGVVAMPGAVANAGERASTHASHLPHDACRAPCRPHHRCHPCCAAAAMPFLPIYDASCCLCLSLLLAAGDRGEIAPAPRSVALFQWDPIPSSDQAAICTETTTRTSRKRVGLLKGRASSTGFQAGNARTRRCCCGAREPAPRCGGGAVRPMDGLVFNSQFYVELVYS